MSRRGPKGKVVGVIQARMNSSRLPGKIMLPLAGAPLLQRIVERVSGAKLLDEIVVATTDTPADAPVMDLCEKLGINCYRGSEADVLGRMIDAASAHDAGVLVRLTADNPLVGADLVDLLLGRFLRAWPDAVYGHTVEGSGFPYGLFVEAAAMTALAVAAELGDDEDHEHVTLYLRRHPERFPALRVDAPCTFTVDHVSVDTREDYDRVSKLFEELFERDPDFGIEAVARSASYESAGTGAGA